MSELKACPFCGAQATLNYVTMRDHRGFEFTAQHKCASCGADGPRAPYVCPPATQDEADKSWNRRTPDRAALVEVARRVLALGPPSAANWMNDIRIERIVTDYMKEQEGK